MGITKPGAILIAVVAVVGSILVLLSLTFGPAAQQQRQMALTKAHGLKLSEQLARNPKFKFIKFHATTDEKLLVSGFVESEKDFLVLKQTISESNPPRPVQYRVNVIDPNLFREMNKQLGSNQVLQPITVPHPER